MLTAKGAATRERIVDGTASEIRELGISTMTLDDVLRRTSTSKSQLFHYFPNGREELLLAVAQREADRVLSDQQPHLSCLDTPDAWRRWRDVVVQRYRQQGINCPLAVLMTELGRSTPAAQQITRELLHQWQSDLKAGVEAMRDGGFLAPDVDSERLSAAFVAAIQGGVTILMSTGSTVHLEAALDTLLDLFE